jgi:hypothetical protein
MRKSRSGREKIREIVLDIVFRGNVFYLWEFLNTAWVGVQSTSHQEGQEMWAGKSESRESLKTKDELNSCKMVCVSVFLKFFNLKLSCCT